MIIHNNKSPNISVSTVACHGDDMVLKTRASLIVWKLFGYKRLDLQQSTVIKYGRKLLLKKVETTKLEAKTHRRVQPGCDGWKGGDASSC